MRAFFRDNGLTIALVAMFLFSVLGMIWSGHAAYNEELREHGAAAIGPAGLSGERRLPLGAVRELGKRIPADVGLCDADRDAVSARLGRVA